ncbi:MAG: hypothetical protein QM783_09045 [Phycisphaerales bacterium]
MPDESVNSVETGGPAWGPETARRKEAIFDVMVAVADRRRRMRRIKQVAGVSLGAAAVVVVVVGVLGSLPATRPSTGNGGATAANTAPPAPVQPVQPKQDVASLPGTTHSLPHSPAPSPTSSNPAPSLVSAGRGVQRLDESKLRRVVVAEPLTDEAFAQELAMQGEYGTVRVGGRGGVLVLNNRAVAEESPPRVH